MLAVLGALVAALVVAATNLAGHGGGRPDANGPSASAHRPTRPAATVRARATGTTTSTSTSSTMPAPTTTDPGTLPQTEAFPTTSSPGFARRMAALWSGVASGVTGQAVPAFFPESAYVQLKDIGDPSADFTGRLLTDYQADVTAAHQLLGADPAAATFVGVDVDAAYGHWVPPGVCDNGVGYFEVPNARVLYSLGGQERSFGIASMISWRGEWYVVHLGAILRSGSGGEVDDPETGPGVSAYSSTC